VAAPVDGSVTGGHPLLLDWLERVRLDPAASLLAPARDEEL
jgi:hypothetical protein